MSRRDDLRDLIPPTEVPPQDEPIGAATDEPIGAATDEPIDAATDEPDETAVLLQQAAAQLAKAAQDRRNRGQALKEVEAALSKIRLADAPELAESPVVQAFLKAMGFADLQPGETRNRGTLAERGREWNWGDLNDRQRFPLKVFTPDESLPITWNGLSLYVTAGEEAMVPEPFYDIWRQRKYAMRQARLHEHYLLGQSDVPPDPNWMTEESAKVRAWSMQGPRGTSGGTLAVGPIITHTEESEGEGG